MLHKETYFCFSNTPTTGFFCDRTELIVLAEIQRAEAVDLNYKTMVPSNFQWCINGPVLIRNFLYFKNYFIKYL